MLQSRSNIGEPLHEPRLRKPAFLPLSFAETLTVFALVEAYAVAECINTMGRLLNISSVYRERKKTSLRTYQPRMREVASVSTEVVPTALAAFLLLFSKCCRIRHEKLAPTVFVIAV